MPVSVSQFGGIIPKTDPSLLPGNEAVLAHNVDLSGGTLKPLKVESEFYKLHDDDGLQVGELPEDDVKSITKPTTLAPFVTPFVVPSSWLHINATVFWSYFDSYGAWQAVPVDTAEDLPYSYRLTENGFTIKAYLPTFSFSASSPDILRTIKLVGPRYQFVYDWENPGPAVGETTPPVQSIGDPEFSPFAVPFIDAYDRLVGEIQCIDVNGPNWDEEYVLDPDGESGGDISITYPPSYVTFTFTMNYRPNVRRFVYYAHTLVTGADREGPPSEPTERLTVPPGHYVHLNNILQSSPKARIYRSTSAGVEAFRLVKETSDPLFVDTLTSQDDEPIPPFGNHPGTLSGFLHTTQRHPAGFGVGYNGNQVYMSDRFRLHAWPKENVNKLAEDPVKAILTTGGTTLVWQGESVYTLNGGNPQYQGTNDLAHFAPLYAASGLARLGSNVFWASRDGIAVSAGGVPEIITKSHFTHQEWADLHPERMRLRTSDHAIYCDTDTAPQTTPGAPYGVYNVFPRSMPSGGGTLPDAINLRFDLRDGALNAVTTYSVTDGSAPYSWKSRLYQNDRKLRWEWGTIDADGPVTLEVWLDGVSAFTGVVNPKVPFSLGAPAAAYSMQFAVSGTAVCRSVNLYDRVVYTVGENVRLTNETAPIWNNIHLRFPNLGRIQGGYISAQTTATIPVQFYADDATTPTFTENVTNKKRFVCTHNQVRATYWRVVIATDAPIDEVVLLPEQNVGAGQ